MKLSQLAGLALIIIGVINKLNIDTVESVAENKTGSISWLSIVIIVIGSIIFTIAFFGCCGAIREGTCLLTTYAVILLCLLIINVAIIVVVFLQFKDDDNSQIRNAIKTGLHNSLSHYNTDTVTRDSVDFIQKEYQCCGVSGPADWDNTWHNSSSPASCCSEPINGVCSISNSYQSGCVDLLFKALKKEGQLFAYVLMGIGAVELVGAIFALCLVSSIRNAYRRSNYA